jgi:DNA-directed RNA polymerase subunit H
MKKETVAAQVAAPVAALEEEKQERKLEPQEKVKEVAPVIKEAIKPEISISIMNDNFVFIDNLYRSRITLLDILAERGYDVEKYRKFSPAEATAAASSLAGLSFIVAKKDNAEHICDVRYITNSRPKMDVFFNDVPDEKSETTEVVVMMEGTVAEIHHQAALKQYMKWKEPNEAGEKTRRKLRVSFFSIYTIVINPMRHVLVPKHEIIPDVEDAHKKLMDSMYITAKSKFPEIKFHTDPIARCIGAVPGDIVKITRPSASSGQAIIYRVCAP